jgi:hypothetical protein
MSVVVPMPAAGRRPTGAQWAREVIGATSSVPLRARRQLLAFYIAEIDDTDARAIVARVAREDDELGLDAIRALHAYVGSPV